jgi:hypothetical protein
MIIVILPSVRDDLEAGFQHYEPRQEFLGEYSLDSLFSDFGSLRLYAGVGDVMAQIGPQVLQVPLE